MSKKVLIGLIAGGVVGVIVIAAVILFFFMNNVLDLFEHTAPAIPKLSATTSALTTTPAPSSISTATSTIPASSPAPTTSAAIPSFSASPSPTASLSPTPVQIADIQFDILSITGSGFNQTVTGQLTNPGSVDLHNAALKIEMFSNGKLIKNDNQDSIVRSFGTLKAGASVQDTVSIKVGIIDGLVAKANGITFVLTFSSDEKNQTIRFEFKP